MRGCRTFLFTCWLCEKKKRGSCWRLIAAAAATCGRRFGCARDADAQRPASPSAEHRRLRSAVRLTQAWLAGTATDETLDFDVRQMWVVTLSVCFLINRRWL